MPTIQIGQYTKINPNFLQEEVTYNISTFELDANYRDSYISNVTISNLPKLLDDDLVELEDGTFKTPAELEVGDLLKTIDVPNPNFVDNTDYNADFLISYEEFVNGTTYSTNPVLSKKRINAFVNLATITFDDDTTWEDTEGAPYLVNRNNDIQFLRIQVLKADDKIILIDTSADSIQFVSKTIKSITTNRTIFSGWEIEVKGAHLFLTKNGNTTLSAEYVAIEHNAPCPQGACYNCNSTCASCPKTVRYCIGASTCSTSKCV